MANFLRISITLRHHVLPGATSKGQPNSVIRFGYYDVPGIDYELPRHFLQK